ncbi:MAG: ubiquinol-cytochrome c reductase iron-sulfur subunit [Candidatus Aminicenantales bacterium]
MRLKHSLFTRRQFLNSLFGGWLAVLAASFLYPIIRFIFPPYREPDEVTLPFSEYKDMKSGAVKIFAWGNKPAYIKKKTEGYYTAFVAVCTHLDCTVTYLPEQKKFFCTCHDGWYDEEGRNIGGPPPRPLRKLRADIEGDSLVVKKEGIE